MQSISKRADSKETEVHNNNYMLQFHTTRGWLYGSSVSILVHFGPFHSSNRLSKTRSPLYVLLIHKSIRKLCMNSEI